MQFAGEELEVILRRQDVPVEVVDFSGRVCLSATGPEVLGRFVLAGYVGVGNHSRIRFVKPEGVRYRPEDFGSQRQIVMNFQASAELARDAQMIPVATGAKRWRPGSWCQDWTRWEDGDDLPEDATMLNWLFKNRLAEPKGLVRSASDLGRDRRNIGLWNDSVPDYSRTAPSPMIRNRARYLAANSAVAARAAQAFVDNVVGPGITLLPKLANQELKAALLENWNAWTDVADLDGLFNIYGLQALAARMMFIDGEVFVRFTTSADGALRLQLLPAEFIDASVTMDNVIAGVEFDAAGRRSAFYIYEWNPGNLLRLPKSNRVPSTEVVQVFRPLVPGQVHGVSALLPIMQKLNDLDQFDRATLVKQKTGALLTGFITTPNENPLGAAQAADGAWTASLEPGTIQRLSPGESLEFSDPPETGGYSDYAKTQLRLIASGLGLPYNVLSGDLSDTSYSSARVGLIEFRKYIDALQWQFVHMFCRPVFQRWIELEVLRGTLQLPETGVQQYVRNISWAPPAMQMTDPQREVDAMVRAIRAGLMSREMAVASLGYDLAEVDAQIAAGNLAADAAGIVLDSDPRRVTQQGNPTVILGNS